MRARTHRFDRLVDEGVGGAIVGYLCPDDSSPLEYADASVHQACSSSAGTATDGSPHTLAADQLARPACRTSHVCGFRPETVTCSLEASSKEHPVAALPAELLDLLRRPSPCFVAR